MNAVYLRVHPDRALYFQRVFLFMLSQCRYDALAQLSAQAARTRYYFSIETLLNLELKAII